jgi:hypothetical protein
MLRVLAISLLLISSTTVFGESSGQVPSNPDHYGCWKASQNIGIENTYTLCISSESISYAVELPNRKCATEGSLAGYGEDGSRAYLIESAKCSDGGGMGGTTYTCERHGADLQCKEWDLILFAKENRLEYLYTLTFSRQETYNKAVNERLRLDR